MPNSVKTVYFSHSKELQKFNFLMFINLLTISSTNLSSFELSSDIVDMARLNEVKFMRLVLVKGHCMHQPLTAISIFSSCETFSRMAEADKAS